jgi:hypothetical protein
MTIADKLREIAALTRRINDAQHAGLKVTAEDWSDLYAATTNLEAIADDLDKPVTIGIHVSEGIVAGVSASIPNFEYFVADEDVFEGSCAGGIDGQIEVDTMTIADRLREIADESPGHFPDAAPMDGCIGCKLNAIAKELDSKAETLDIIASEVEDGRGTEYIKEIQDISSYLGGKVNV